MQWYLAGDHGGTESHRRAQGSRTSQVAVMERISLGEDWSGLVGHMIARFGVRPEQAADMADDVLKIVADGCVAERAGVARAAAVG